MCFPPKSLLQNYDCVLKPSYKRLIQPEFSQQSLLGILDPGNRGHYGREREIKMKLSFHLWVMKLIKQMSLSSVFFCISLMAIGCQRFTISVIPKDIPIKGDKELWSRFSGYIGSSAQPIEGFVIDNTTEFAQTSEFLEGSMGQWG